MTFSPSVQTVLSYEGSKFCQEIADFCTANEISIRGLSKICDGSRTGLSKSTADRILKGTIGPEQLERLRPALFDGLYKFLECRRHHADEIEQILSPIFDKQEFTNMLNSRCELDPLVVRFFDLRFDPFDVDRIPSEDELFTTPELDATVQRVKDAVLFQRFIAVIGDIGSGKTLLKHRVAAELEREDTIKTHLIYPEFPEVEQIEVHQIASYILSDLGQTVPQSKLERVKKIKQLLEDMYYEDIRVSFMIDEAHHLNARVLTSLKNFWELTKGISTLTNGRNRSMTNRLLGIVLFGQPQFETTQMRDVRFKEIRQRVQIIPMPSMVKKVRGKAADITAARQYVEHRIRLAGGDPSRLFEDEALDAICRNASTPLTLGNLTNEALREAFDKQEKQVQIGFTFFKNLREDHGVIAMRRSA